MGTRWAIVVDTFGAFEVALAHGLAIAAKSCRARGAA
jgi:hypothetical protein